MHISWTFTGDGILAFVGGALALLGVWWSNRQSVKNLKEQLEGEKRAHAAEAQERARAVATAILFEVDYIYRYVIRDMEDLIKGYPPGLDWAYELAGKRTERMPFVVYESNAGLLGSLNQPLAEGVVHLYGHLTHVFTALNNVSAVVDRATSASLGDARRTLVEELAEHLKCWLPPVGKLTEEVSEQLCVFTGVPRERIAALANESSTNAQAQ